MTEPVLDKQTISILEKQTISILKNKKARELSTLIIAQLEQDAKDEDIPLHKLKRKLVEALAEEIGSAVVPNYKVKHFVMPPNRIKTFEKSQMPFGKYAGQEVGVVHENDSDYLTWLADSAFMKDLGKYLKAKETDRD